MSWNPNSAKHKAEHGGYRDKPTQKEVRANLDFWASMRNFPVDKVVNVSSTPGLTKPKGTQLKLNF